MMSGPGKKLLDAVTSLKLTIACLAALMALVVACTLAQVNLGTLGAVNLYIRSWLVWYDVPGTPWSVAVFPGGALVGLVLMVNLIAAQLRRLELSWRKSGLWIIHAGLILLFVGEFVTSVAQVDAQMAIEVGQTANYTVSPRLLELALVDTTDPGYDDVRGVPERLLASGERVEIPGTPLAVQGKAWFANAALQQRRPTDPPSLADRDLGAMATVVPLEPITSEEGMNTAAAFVEVTAGGVRQGTWLVSSVLEQPQGFVYGGRTYTLQLRARREYLPYAVTLKKFSHDVYPGTDIPKNFSSLVHIEHPARGEARDVLIYMNQPLRYEGKTFYQASFGKGDTLSVLQVVQNPGWLIPYISCVLVTVGLLVHFALALTRWVRKTTARTAEATR